MSMLWRLRKVLLSRGISMFEGCWIGSHIIIRQVRRGSLYPHRVWGGQVLYTLTCPVQCKTWNNDFWMRNKLRMYFLYMSNCLFTSKPLITAKIRYLPRGRLEVNSSASVGNGAFHPHEEVTLSWHLFAFLSKAWTCIGKTANKFSQFCFLIFLFISKQDSMEITD